MTSDSASRVTRSRRSLWLAIALFTGGIVAVGALRAQQTPASVEPAPVPGTEGTDVVDDSATTAPAPDETPPKPADTKSPPAGGASRQSQERFEPTEKVRADFDVSFPVDI